MSTSTRPDARPCRGRALLALALAASLGLVGAACSSDDEGGSPTTTTAASTTDAGTEPTTTTASGSTTTDGSDDTDPSSTTTEQGPPATGELADVLGEVAGFDRAADEETFDGELCDGSTASVSSGDQQVVTYTSQADEDVELMITRIQLGSSADARTLYDELAETTSGCENDGLTVDQGTDTDIGDPGIVFSIDLGDVRFQLYVSLADDALWVLADDGGQTPTGPGGPVYDVFAAAVPKG